MTTYQQLEEAREDDFYQTGGVGIGALYPATEQIQSITQS
jgi:hypothetical protein